MSSEQLKNTEAGGRRNYTVAAVCAGVVLGMTALAYASVPLYRIFCQVTGYGGTPQVAEHEADTILDKTVKIRFDANVAGNLAWTFKPEQNLLSVRLGETKLAFYKARNNAKHTVTGTATFNVTPDWAAQYFNKIDCFCFTEQTLQPGESADMAVQFFVDPAILQDRDAARLDTLTLSYTFFPAADQKGQAPLAAKGEGEKKSGGAS